MRSLALGLLALFLVAPLAAADQDLSQGPARVQTTHFTEYGSCAAGNGYEGSSAEATVTLSETQGLDARYIETCRAYTDGGYADHEARQSFAAYRYNEGAYAYALYYDWQGYQNNGGYHYCRDSLTVAGVSPEFGCILNSDPRPTIGQYLP
jgi:hypothetical protein